MKRRIARLALPLAFAALAGAAPAAGEDLVTIYRDAQLNDPQLAAARSNWVATQERVPQARSGLLPSVSLSGAANANDSRQEFRGSNGTVTAGSFGNANYAISASQPLYRQQNLLAFDQARQQVEQADYTLASAQQDVILRVAQAYFDVLLAEYTVELANAQKAAVAEQLAQAKRNFEVGVATITDTNEAQARFDAIVAQEISVQNDLENRRTALRAIIGRAPKDLKKLGPGFEPAVPQPASADFWVDRALNENLAVRIARYNFEIATLEIDRQRAANYPTVDLVGSFGQNYGTGSIQNNLDVVGRTAQIGVQLNVPLYTGGLTSSRVREAIALQESSRQNLETARRLALFNAQTGYTGVLSAAASVKAFEQAVASSEVALQSNKLGQEVGVRTNLDVLNQTQVVFQNRRDLANAYMAYLLSVLRLKAAVGSLAEEDLIEINRRLRG
jgi:outer membrane protein